MKITLKDGRELDSIPFVNPDETFGKPYLIGTSCGYSVYFGLVIADDLGSAIDEYVESHHGEGLRIPDEDREDYITVTIDGERMEVYDARKRFPEMDISAVIENGWADGSTEDRANYTGQGEVYDSDHLYAEDMESIRKIESEPDDWKAFPKQFEDMAETRDIVREHFGRSAFLSEWADATEERNRCFPGEFPGLSGMDIADCAPEDTPTEYVRWAETSIRTIERSIGIGIVEALNRACRVPVLNSWEDRLDADDYGTAETFGHYIGMSFQGHGVSWNDDHPPMPFELPFGESPCLFGTGEVSLEELE